MKKVVLSGMIGNSLEWYDYALYGFLTPIIGRLFFPSDDAYASQLAAFGVFAVGFAMRPLGAVLFGWLGDRYGRKMSLAVSILMMAIPTSCIGLLPTYAQIGIWAPILLTLIRLLQGLSLGGEFSGSIAFMVEHAPQKHRGLVGSAAVSSLIFGMLLGSGAATLTAHLLTPQAFEDWGWRLPFLIGIAIGFVGFYIRKHTDESPHFEHAKHTGYLSDRPLREVFSQHLPQMLQAIGLYLTVTVPFYTLTVFINSFLQTNLGYAREQTLLMTTVGMALLLVLTPVSPMISDRIGRKKVLTVGAALVLLFIYPVFLLLTAGGFWQPLFGICVFATVLSIYISPIPTVLVELFPTRVRYSGMAISYNFCAALFGGTAPMVGVWLIKQTGNHLIMAFYLMLCAAISLFTLCFFKDRYKEPL